MKQLFTIALRDLGRNRRRSFFSALALAMGLGLLLIGASFIRGEMDSAMTSTIRLQSGHLQIRSQSYDESKTSLKWEDLVEDPAQVASQIASLAPVKAATPRLFASGIISVRDESAGVRVMGIDPQSEANDPYREGVVSGEYLSADDRDGLLIGQPLAEKLGVQTGDQVNLSVNTSNGDIDEQVFTVRGIYSTQTNGFDLATIFLPLAKAQAMTRTENHASTIFVLLNDRDQTQAVISALQTGGYKLLTWTEMNEILIQTEDMSNAYMSLVYMIVLAITATVIVNTLIMAVYERTREIGILSAIGMKSGRIMFMFLAEAFMLAVGGVFMGLILGYLAVAGLSINGLYIGNMGLSGFLIPNTVYPRLTVESMVNLSITAFVVTLLAGLYPAILAARMEPVQALRTEN